MSRLGIELGLRDLSLCSTFITLYEARLEWPLLSEGGSRKFIRNMHKAGIQRHPLCVENGRRGEPPLQTPSSHAWQSRAKFSESSHVTLCSVSHTIEPEYGLVAEAR